MKQPHRKDRARGPNRVPPRQGTAADIDDPRRQPRPGDTGHG
eukprot:gene16874-20626_t